MLYNRSKKHYNTEYTVNDHFLSLKAKTTGVFIISFPGPTIQSLPHIQFSSVQLLSHVQLFATLGAVAHQAPLSTGFSRQEHWSGLPFPSPMHESEK